MLNINACIRKPAKANGFNSILLRVTINRVSKYYSLYIETKEQHFKAGRVTSNDREYFKKNQIIDKTINKAKSIVYDFQINDIEATHDNFKRAYLGDNRNFYTYFSECLKTMVVKESTKKQYKAEFSKLKAFRENIFWNDINPKFIREYTHYMTVKLENKNNTVWKTYKALKHIAALAVQDNIIKRNPFLETGIKYHNTVRTFLTLDELEKIELLYDLPEKLEVVRTAFLFACYTGLRFTDLKSLVWGNVTEKYIYFSQTKTETGNLIPLTLKAKKHLPGKRGKGSECVFKVFSNQKTNDYLKAILFRTDINKDVSFHTSRHTFAVISLNLGIPLEVVSELLGHTELKTTRIYAKLLNETKQKNMNLWDKKPGSI